MSHLQDERSAQFYIETYDESVSDWPDEIDFYQEMAVNAKFTGGYILELACDTGRELGHDLGCASCPGASLISNSLVRLRKVAPPNIALEQNGNARRIEIL